MPVGGRQYEGEHPFVQTDPGSCNIRQFQENLVPPLTEPYTDGPASSKVLVSEFRFCIDALVGISPYGW